MLSSDICLAFRKGRLRDNQPSRGSHGFYVRGKKKREASMVQILSNLKVCGIAMASILYPADGVHGVRLVPERTAWTKTAMLSPLATTVCGWCHNSDVQRIAGLMAKRFIRTRCRLVVMQHVGGNPWKRILCDWSAIVASLSHMGYVG